MNTTEINDYNFIIQATKLVENEVSQPENISMILSGFGELKKKVLPYKNFILYPLKTYRRQIDEYKHNKTDSDCIGVMSIEMFDDIHYFAYSIHNNEIDIFDPRIKGREYSTYTLNIIQLLRDIFQPSQIKIHLLPENFSFQIHENIYKEGQENHLSCLWSLFYLHCLAYNIDLYELSDFITHTNLSQLFLIKRYAYSLCDYYKFDCMNTSLFKTYFKKIALEGSKYKCFRINFNSHCSSIVDVLHYALLPVKTKMIGKSQVPREIKYIQHTKKNRKRKRYFESEC